jgi:three-Cys-motif partner protein
MALKENQFFEKQTVSSRIKASIVSEYFPSYSKIIVKKYTPKAVRYIDLFAGPGFYNDKNPSTPILIAKQCQKDAELKDTVKMIFNDNCYAEELKKNFNSEFEENTFKHKPHFGKSTVGESPEITEFLIKDTHVNNRNEYPSLLFIDPFGYKGIETKVLAEFLKNWGNEIFLFVNTKSIHPALENEKFEGLMNDLFPTTFKFQEEDADATSHYILHITKGSRGYDLIKTIYNDFANVGTVFDGVNTYTFDAKKFENPVNELFDLNSINIDKLKDELYSKYKGREMVANDLFESHHIINTTAPYARSHYTEALRRLVVEDKMSAEFTDNRQHKVSVLISKECLLKFR